MVRNVVSLISQLLFLSHERMDLGWDLPKFVPWCSFQFVSDFSDFSLTRLSADEPAFSITVAVGKRIFKWRREGEKGERTAGVNPPCTGTVRARPLSGHENFPVPAGQAR